MTGALLALADAPFGHDAPLFYCVPLGPGFRWVTLGAGVGCLHRRGISVAVGWTVFMCLLQVVVTNNYEYPFGRSDACALRLALVAPTLFLVTLGSWFAMRREAAVAR